MSWAWTGPAATCDATNAAKSQRMANFPARDVLNRATTLGIVYQSTLPTLTSQADPSIAG